MTWLYKTRRRIVWRQWYDLALVAVIAISMAIAVFYLILACAALR